MKTLASLMLLVLLAGCVSSPGTGTVTPAQQTIANAVEDLLTVGLVPVFTKNPSYLAAANTVALSLGTFAGDTITPADVDAFLSKTPMTDADKKAVAGVVNAAWQVFTKRYAQQVGAGTRPDVKLFLSAVSEGIKNAVAATPK